MAFCALRSFEEATNFIAVVIFKVPLTELILSFVSLSDPIYCRFWQTAEATASISFLSSSDRTPLARFSRTFP